MDEQLKKTIDGVVLGYAQACGAKVDGTLAEDDRVIVDFGSATFRVRGEGRYGQREPEVLVDWSSMGTCSPEKAEAFLRDLQRATFLAVSVEGIINAAKVLP